MNWAELSYELGRVVLVRDFIGPSGLVRVVFGPSCPAPFSSTGSFSYIDIYVRFGRFCTLKGVVVVVLLPI